METWTDREYADPVPYLRHRGELVRSLGPALEPGDRLVDLACGDGGLADFLPGIDYVGVDADPRMVEEAPGEGPHDRPRRPERVRAGCAGRGDHDLPGDLLRA